MDKTTAVEIVLEKRFGDKDPKNISELLEINTISNEDKAEDAFGIGIQLVLQDENKNKIIEEYQVNKDGIVFSWGHTTVIDERSLKNQL